MNQQQQKKKTFLGFGLGAVQSGLFLFEAMKSKNFERYVIVETNQDVVDAVRKWGNSIVVNTAGKNGIVSSVLSGIEIYNPTIPADLPSITSAITDADEMATAVPSVDFYDVGEQPIAKLLAENVNLSKPRVLYAAENNNYAAEILKRKMEAYVPAARLQKFETLNTVIGKMGGVVFHRQTIEELGLQMMTPFSSAAILVEEFNHIIVSKITLSDIQRGIEVFVEKEDLIPFEEAKLFGHNAVHSMLGFFAAMRGYRHMSEIRNDPHLYSLGVHAFASESGAFLLKKFAGVNDQLFTPAGFEFYGTDLLERMTNPWLRDEVVRICRDPVRKLEYDDRFFGTIRGALEQGVRPIILGRAVLAGICYIIRNRSEPALGYPSTIEELTEESVRKVMKGIWKDRADRVENEECVRLVCSELPEFKEEFIYVKNT
jgi:mannitol-1-phosphate 5-dehydrogenase